MMRYGISKAGLCFRWPKSGLGGSWKFGFEVARGESRFCDPLSKGRKKTNKKNHFREKVFPVSCVSVDASPVSPAMNPSVDSRPSVEAVFSDYVSHLQEDQELREVKETFRVISQVPF